VASCVQFLDADTAYNIWCFPMGFSWNHGEEESDQFKRKEMVQKLRRLTSSFCNIGFIFLFHKIAQMEINKRIFNRLEDKDFT